MTDFHDLVFSEDEKRLVASIRPSSERPTLNLDTLRGLLKQAGYERWHLSEEALLTLIESFNSPIPETELLIGECRDASFTLGISDDAMQEWVNVVSAWGGRALEPDDIYMALGVAGVTFGVDQAAVSTLCSSSAASEAEHVTVATGMPAENGKNVCFELLVPNARDRSPQVDEHGLIDYHELGAIATVTAGQPLMRRIPPTTGTAGRNVHGELLEPVPGRNESFAENLLGAELSSDDANLLLATFSGQPVCCANGVIIEPILTIRNVNMATGNITFDGTVNIQGEVLPGMKVRASGDIVVGEVVDGALLDAGGDIYVAGGIIAKAQVRAGGSVSARFVENAHVFSGTTIAVDDTVLHSELQANNQIIVGIKSTQRGRLAGGSARAMMLIKTPILGLSTGGVTSLLLGVNPVLEAKYQELLKKIEKQREDESNLEKLIKHLSAQGDKAGMLPRVKASWQQSVQGWAKLLPERDALEKQLALIETARIEVGSSVEGSIDMTFGKKVVHMRQRYRSGTFTMDGERIVFTDLEGNVKQAG